MEKSKHSHTAFLQAGLPSLQAGLAAILSQLGGRPPRTGILYMFQTLVGEPYSRMLLPSLSLMFV